MDRKGGGDIQRHYRVLFFIIDRLTLYFNKIVLYINLQSDKVYLKVVAS